jgi:hypothetical protein
VHLVPAQTNHPHTESLMTYPTHASTLRWFILSICNGQLGYASFNGRFYASTDGGKTWKLARQLD